MRWKSSTPSSPEVASRLKFMSWMTRSISSRPSMARPSSGVPAWRTESFCRVSRTSSAVRTAALSSISRTTGMPRTRRVAARRLGAGDASSEQAQSSRGGTGYEYPSRVSPSDAPARGKVVGIRAAPAREPAPLEGSLHGPRGYGGWHRGGAARGDENGQLADDPHGPDADGDVERAQL